MPLRCLYFYLKFLFIEQSIDKLEFGIIIKKKIPCFKTGDLAFSDFLIHGPGIILTDILCHLDHFHRHGSSAHSDFDPVAYLDIVAGLDHSAVHADTTVVAGFIGHRPTLDQPGDLQILVKSHKNLIT